MGNKLVKTRTRSGMAMVMMLMLVPVLMFLAMSFVDPIVRSFRSAVNDQKTLLAKNVADSMFEFALWDSRGTGVGENKKNEGYPDQIIKEYDFGTASIRWSVMGTPEVDTDSLINGKYTIPSPGSGTAGDDYCSTLEPVVNDDSLGTILGTLEIDKTNLGGNNYDAFSWPCNWNKLHEGESITIPLYTENANGSVNHPFEFVGTNDFALKIRPACDPSKATSRDDEYESEICNDNERYVMGGDVGNINDTILVLWEITGRLGDKDGESVYLTHYESSDIFSPSTTLDVENINSQIPLTNISKASKPIDDLDDSIEDYLSNLYKPELRILAVHTLKDNNSNIVPYLEYQFSSTYNSGSTPVSNTSKVVHVEVMIDGGYSETIEKTVGIAKSVSGFVIQQ